jgi:vacuolar-type H+-ATPase subunit H
METLKAIKEREIESQKRIEEARARGSKIVRDAETEAKKIVSDAEEDSRKYYEDFLKREMELTALEIKEIKKRFEERAGKLDRKISQEIVDKMIELLMENRE